MTSARNRVEVMHGPNFDVLERRDPKQYQHLLPGAEGPLSLPELERQIRNWGRELGLEVRCFQSNMEGEFIEHLHRLPELADAVIINAGAWTHYSWAIRDALDLAGLLAVELHLSDVGAREDFRKTSVFEGLVLEKITGRGPDGYRDALALLGGELGVVSGAEAEG
jgi:3-dehydroquinate dehydratase II